MGEAHPRLPLQEKTKDRGTDTPVLFIKTFVKVFGVSDLFSKRSDKKPKKGLTKNPKRSDKKLKNYISST